MVVVEEKRGDNPKELWEREGIIIAGKERGTRTREPNVKHASSRK